MTPAQSQALEWLKQHNGTGVFDKNGVLLAAGELAPHTRSTWNALRDLGMVTMVGRPARVAVATPALGRR